MNSQQHLPAHLCCALLLLATLALGKAAFAQDNVPAVNLESHTPRFHWKTDMDGKQWLYDGETAVGKFFGGYDEKSPLKGIARPISLHQLRLIPGGPLFIRDGETCGPLYLSWHKHLIFYMQIDELKIDQDDPVQFKLYVKSHDIGRRNDQLNPASYQPGNVVEQTWLKVT
jgi:hypothetical protein